MDSDVSPDDSEDRDEAGSDTATDAVPEMTVAQARAALCGVAMLSGPALRALAELAGHIGPRKFPDAFAEDEIVPDQPSRKAAAKALRVLTAIARDDLTLNEAADKLCISIHSANHQIADARRMFGAATNLGAVVNAIKAGAIEV
ncbi:MAG: hypothetical protein MI755_05530 [Sphingomonadales bacterium]|nr:hypothetical protein [Sphingomonadales bacterium]